MNSKYYLAPISDFHIRSRIEFTSPTETVAKRINQIAVMETLLTLTIRRDIRRLRTLYERAIQEDLPLEITKPIVKELKDKLTQLEEALEKRAIELAQQEANQQ